MSIKQMTLVWQLKLDTHAQQPVQHLQFKV